MAPHCANDSLLHLMTLKSQPVIIVSHVIVTLILTFRNALMTLSLSLNDPYDVYEKSNIRNYIHQSGCRVEGKRWALPRQQKFRAMNGAHLASPIRGELGYAHWPQLGTQFIALLGTKFGAH